MKPKFEEFIKLCRLFLFGAAMLLLSAVAENGRTELSRKLIANMDDVPEMIEALIAGLLIIVAGGFAASYIDRNNT